MGRDVAHPALPRQRWRLIAIVAVLNSILLAAGFALAVTRIGDRADGSTGAGARVDAGSGAPGGTVGIDPLAEIPVPGGTSGLPARRSAGAGEVAERPWPSRVAAAGPWSATLAGKGDRIEVTAAGSVAGGLAGSSVDLGSSDPRRAGDEAPRTNRHLALPDGNRWYALGRIRLEGSGDVPFSSLTASRRDVSAAASSFEAVVGAAQAGLVGVGSFVQADGRKVDRLALPAGTRLVGECREAPPFPPPCQVPDPAPIAVKVTAREALTIRAAGSGEAAVAGSARASALGRTWEGLVAAIEAQQLRAVATYDGDRWTMAADGATARQVWVDVWPVVDTKLAATSKARGTRGFFDALQGDSYDVGIQWTNVGFATSQIFEAEGVGPGAKDVGFDLNKTLGHGAGLNVARGDRVVNMRGGGDIDSNLAPGESVDRGLSAPRGSSATVVLRGNFPEVRVALAIPPP
jgi:hypothetical protein